jgi:hypothetical protein
MSSSGSCPHPDEQTALRANSSTASGSSKFRDARGQPHLTTNHVRHRLNYFCRPHGAQAWRDSECTKDHRLAVKIALQHVSSLVVFIDLSKRKWWMTRLSSISGWPFTVFVHGLPGRAWQAPHFNVKPN